MKISNTLQISGYLLLILASTTIANPFFESAFKDIKKNIFGAIEIANWNGGKMEKEVYLPDPTSFTEQTRQAEIVHQAEQYGIKHEKRLKSGEIFDCDGEHRTKGQPYDAPHFFPVYVGQLNADNPTFSFYSGRCFQNITFSYEQILTLEGELQEIIITVLPQEGQSSFCKDWLAFLTHQFYHFETFFSETTHALTFRNFQKEAIYDIQIHGVRIYMFCDGYLDTFYSAFNFAKMYLGGFSAHSSIPIFGSHVASYQEHENVKFLTNIMGFDLQKRDIDYYEYKDEDIKDGDIVGLFRLDGVDPLIMYGTGGYIGHCAMALWFDGELYLIEAQQSWFWPKKYVQRNKFQDWVQYAKNADYHVSHLPLRQEIRDKFNATAAKEFFFRTEGLSYGFFNMIFNWIDSVDLAQFIPYRALTPVFHIFETIFPESAQIFVNSALNKRLGTVGLTIQQLSIEAGKQNITLDEVFAEPEQDGWIYTGLEPKDGESWVCSTYIVGAFKAGGLFDGLTIQATEFTPRDLYELDFYDKDYKSTNENCLKYDSDQPWCQFLGKYRMKFPNYSTITPYSNMNERCAMVAPLYEREDGC